MLKGKYIAQNAGFKNKILNPLIGYNYIVRWPIFPEL